MCSDTLKYFKDYDATKTVAEITQPQQSRLLNKLIKNSKLEIIPQAGHLVLYEKPGQLAEIMHRFIEQNK